MTMTHPTPALRSDRERLRDELLHHEDGPCLTLVLPVDPTEGRQIGIRTRNLLKEASERLEARGADAATASSVVESVRGLLPGSRPLSRSVRAVVAFGAAGVGRVASLPFGAPQVVHVGDTFHLTALSGSLDPIHCLVLTISRAGCALWKADRWELRALDLPGAPGELADVTWFRDLERQLQMHSTGGGSGTFHGQGIDEDPYLESIRTYLREVDGVVRRVVESTDTPLLLVGPGRLPAIYRSVSGHRRFLEAIEIHPDGLTEAELGERAAGAVAALGASRTTTLSEEVGELVASGRAITDPVEIVAAAGRGQVRTLVFDPRSPGGHTNSALAGTLTHGGDAVPVFEAGPLPPLAALLRY